MTDHTNTITIDPPVGNPDLNRSYIAGEAARLMRAHPDLTDQGGWVAAGDTPIYTEEDVRRQLTTPVGEWACGTVACAAGWILVAALEANPDLDIPLLENDALADAVDFFAAGRLLGLDEAESDLLFIQSDRDEAIERLEAIAAGGR